jgi:type VI secretion system secreted protein VgrG
MTVHFACEGTRLEPRSLHGIEELGEPTRLELELIAAEPLAEPRALVGKACAVLLESAYGSRPIHGVVRSIACIVSSDPGGARRYRVTMSSALGQLELRRDCRVFQHRSGPEIASALIEACGGGAARMELSSSHRPIRYRTQYDEPSLAFMRRVCEREGFWYRFEPGDGADEVVLCDEVKTAPDAPLDGPLMLREQAGLAAERPRAWALCAARERRPGAVRAAGYNFRKPALRVEAEVRADSDQATQLLCVAPDASSADDAGRSARIALEAARAGGERVRFSTSAIRLAPGRRFELDLVDEQLAPPRLFCVRVEHDWTKDAGYACQVEAAPAELPFRLAQRTPPPKISGLQSAIVTGPAGQEIHADDDGCVRVHFHWDRSGSVDGESSLPVRVVHPNLEGSMLLPRIGWEVWVAFENGDPDRPFIIGRAYNASHPPPVALPANKSMTVLSTSSSPGAGCTNAISYDDAAGKQALSFNAGKGLTKSVGNNASAQTMADERVVIDGSKTLSVGANQDEGVKGPRVVQTQLLSVTVAGNQIIKSPAAIHSQVGSEMVSCATLIEQVGSPGGALGALAFQAAMTVGGLIPLPGGWETAKGIALGVVGTGKAAYDAYQTDGATGAAIEVGKGALKLVPGGDLIGDAIDVLESGNHVPWKGDAKKKEEQEQVGRRRDGTVGGGPAAAAGSAADGGGGNRVHEVAGAMSEAIGGAYSIATGGQSKWTTLGASIITVGGPHATAAGKSSWLAGGASTHNTGAYSVTAGSTLTRTARVMQSTLATLSINAGSGIELQGVSISVTCGALTINGKLVLDAGGTKVTIDGSGLTVEGATVDFDGPVLCKQSDRS